MVSIFRPLKGEIEKYLSKEQVESVYRAYQFAEKAHNRQKRYSGERYISHPVIVATILATMRMDTSSVISAILHDVLEDTSVQRKTIKEMFGEERLREIFSRTGRKPLDEVRNSILKALEDYDCDDDVTFVLLRRL